MAVLHSRRALSLTVFRNFAMTAEAPDWASTLIDSSTGTSVTRAGWSIPHSVVTNRALPNLLVHPLADIADCTIGPRTRVWQFVVILKGARIGADCNICAHVLIEGDVVVGDRVTVKSGVQLWNGMRVGNDVFIGPNATFTNDKYPRSKIHPEHFAETVIEDDASIGAGAVILPGIRIGAASVVGAGAVVTKDVPARATMVGNPAQARQSSNTLAV